MRQIVTKLFFNVFVIDYQIEEQPNFVFLAPFVYLSLIKPFIMKYILLLTAVFLCCYSSYCQPDTTIKDSKKKEFFYFTTPAKLPWRYR
jgi:hypothetical protein